MERSFSTAYRRQRPDASTTPRKGVADGGDAAPPGHGFEVPDWLPYVFLAAAVLAAVLMPIWLATLPHLPGEEDEVSRLQFEKIKGGYPTRAVAEQPIEGIHFTRGYLHAEGRALGPETSDRFVVEFTDFFCHHCHEAHRLTMEPLLREFGASGQVRIESHPVAFLHDDSLRAAHAALCAQEQHKYWEMRHLLFQAPMAGSDEGGSVFTGRLLRRLAEEAGLDIESFVQCFTSARHKEEVESLSELARAMGVQATPSFFVGPTHDMLEGVVAYADLRAKLHL